MLGEFQSILTEHTRTIYCPSFFFFPLFFLFLVEAIPRNQSGQQEVSAPFEVRSAVWSKRRVPHEHHRSAQRHRPSRILFHHHHFVHLPGLHRSDFRTHLRAQHHDYCPTQHHQVSCTCFTEGICPTWWDATVLSATGLFMLILLKLVEWFKTFFFFNTVTFLNAVPLALWPLDCCLVHISAFTS